MRIAHHLGVWSVSLVAVAGMAYGQQVISAQSGTIHYVEGTVYVNGKVIQAKTGDFVTLRPGEELRTATGRAEVLLTPGAFLRIGNQSAVRMVENRLSDTRLELRSGAATIECDLLLKDNRLTMVVGSGTISVNKHGLYRFNANPAEVRVYDGEAVVQTASGQLKLKKGKRAQLDGTLVAAKFDPKKGDMLDAWGSQRSALLASASASSARSLLGSQTPWRTAGWYFNPYYSMYTFLPGSGIVYSPFGYTFWSPVYLGNFGTGGYRPGISSGVNAESQGGGFGNGGVANGGGGYSVNSGSAPAANVDTGSRGGFGGGSSVSSAPAAAAPSGGRR